MSPLEFDLVKHAFDVHKKLGESTKLYYWTGRIPDEVVLMEFPLIRTRNKAFYDLQCDISDFALITKLSNGDAV